LELDIPLVHQLDRPKWRTLSQMITKGINSPSTSSLGRLFDAVAALLRLRSEVLYEGQAAIELEMLAQSGHYVHGGGHASQMKPYPFTIQDQTPAKLDVTSMIRAIVDDIQQNLPVH